MNEFFDKALNERRSLQQALADLRAGYQRRPSYELGEMIQNVEAEIAERDAAREAKQRNRAA